MEARDSKDVQSRLAAADKLHCEMSACSVDCSEARQSDAENY